MRVSKEWICIRAASGVSLAELAESCYRISPQVVFFFSEAVFLEISQVRHLLSRASVKLRVYLLAKRLGVSIAATAESEDPAWAWVLTHLPTSTPGFYRDTAEQDWPITELALYARAFGKNPDLEKELFEALVILNQLGVKTLRELFSIPESQLNCRFPLRLIQLLRKLKREREWTVPKFQVPDEITEGEDFPWDAPCRHRDGVDVVTQKLLSRLAVRLHARGVLLGRLEIKFFFSGLGSAPHSVLIQIFHPMGGVFHLWEVIRNQLDHHLPKSGEDAVIRIELWVRQTVKGRQQQADFFCKKEQVLEQQRILENHLQSLVGEGNVFFSQEVSTHIPEERWRRTREISEQYGDRPIQDDQAYDATNPQADSERKGPERPSRIFPIPRQIQMDAFRAVRELTQNLSYRIVSIQGPERILPEWWRRKRGWGLRDYFKVRALTPAQIEVGLWVFRDDQKRFFLHGYFD